jgi:DNA-binding response OmpR family regulator
MGSVPYSPVPEDSWASSSTTDVSPWTDVFPQAVLMVGPRRDVTDAWRAELERQGFAVQHEPNATLGAATARASGVALMVIDVDDRSSGGLQAIKMIREEGNPATILAVTPADRVATAIESIDSGADSCTDQLCTPRELAARLYALIRRPRPGESPISASWTLGDLRVDPASRRVLREGRQVTLPPREFAVFVALLRRRGRVVGVEELLGDVWRDRPATRAHAVEDTISGLRRKLWLRPTDAGYIHTVRSGGYLIW